MLSGIYIVVHCDYIFIRLQYIHIFDQILMSCISVNSIIEHRYLDSGFMLKTLDSEYHVPDRHSYTKNINIQKGCYYINDTTNN